MLASGACGSLDSPVLVPAGIHGLQVWGNLGAFLERLDDEWNGSLKVGRLDISE